MVLSRRLGPQGFGVYGTYKQFANFLDALLLFPIGIPFVRQILSAGNIAEKNALISSSFWFTALISIFFAVAIRILQPVFSFGPTNKELNGFIFYFICYSFFLCTYNSLRGLLQLKKASLFLLLGLGVFPLVLAAIIQKFTVKDFFIWSGICLLLPILHILKKYSFRKIKITDLIGNFISNFKNGFPRSLSTIFYQGAFLISPLLLIKNGLVKEAGFFVLAQNIPKLLESLMEGIHRAGVPLLINKLQLWKEGKNTKIIPKIKTMEDLAFGIGLFSMNFVCLNSKSLVILFFGEKFSGASQYFFIIALSLPWFMLFSFHKTIMEASSNNLLSLFCTSLSVTAFFLSYVFLKSINSCEFSVLMSFAVFLSLLGVQSCLVVKSQFYAEKGKKIRPLFLIYAGLLGCCLIIQLDLFSCATKFEGYTWFLNFLNFFWFGFFIQNAYLKILKR